MNDFWKENGLDGSQGDRKALGHPQRPRQAQPRGVKQVPFILIKNWHDKNWRGTCFYPIIQRKVDLEWFQVDQDDLGHPQQPQLTMVKRDEVAEGVWEHLDHPVSCWDRFKSICLWKILYKHVQCQFLINITGTCCTRHSGVCRGRWECPRTSWSPWNHLKSIYLYLKKIYEHAPC